MSRCDANANSWCCAGAAGQGLGGPGAVDCCSTNLTTALEPYPLATVEQLETSTRTTKTTTHHSVSSRTSLTRSDEAPTLSTTTPTRSSTPSTTSQSSGSALVPPASSSASSQPAKESHNNSKTAVKIAVPMAIVVIILLACLVFLILRKKQFRYLRKWRHPADAQNNYTRTSDHHELAGSSILELDVTHYELPHPKAPTHELG